MKTTIFIFSLSILLVLAQSENVVKKKWKEFKNKYNKSYTSQEEEKQRFKIFKKNLNNIEKHNNQNMTYKKAMNLFGDLTSDEFAAYVFIDEGLANPPKFGNKTLPFIPPINNTLTLPFQIDWRDRGVVGRVKNQGRCGSCWSFSAVAAIESQLAIKKGHVTYLSEQDIVDCSRDYDNQGCSGGWASWAFDYVMDHGLAKESDYPYTAQEGQCQRGNASVTKIAGYYRLPVGSEVCLQYFVGVKGPVSVSIDATAEMQFYASGVFEDINCNPHYSNHAVLVVGYGVDKKGIDYWIVKNSWGVEWGQEGYFYLARNAGSRCAVASVAVFPFL